MEKKIANYIFNNKGSRKCDIAKGLGMTEDAIAESFHALERKGMVWFKIVRNPSTDAFEQRWYLTKDGDSWYNVILK